MTQPYVRERQIAGQTWHVVCARFASSFMAKQAMERLMLKVPRGSLGVYRHGPAAEPGVMVTALGLDEHEVRRAAAQLRLGEHEPLDNLTTDAMIARRARFVLESIKQGRDTGRYVTRRPEQRGAHMTPDGQMIEPDPGQG